MAAYQDLFIEQGTTYSTEITLDDSYGTPYDLTNFSVKAQAKKSYYTNTIALDFDASVSSPHDGLIQLSATAQKTANVSTYKLIYDVVITDNDTGSVTRVLEGQIFMSPAVTR